MLKFSDLRVDMKSFENTLDSFMKLFPNSYMPLLVMYLTREGKLKLECDVKDNSHGIIASVTKEKLTEFFSEGGPVIDASNIALPQGEGNVKKFLSQMQEAGFDLSVFNPYLYLCSCKFDNNLALAIDKDNNKSLCKVIEIIQKHEPDHKEEAAFWYMLYMIMQETETLYEKEYPEDPASESESSLADWANEFNRILQRILDFSGDKLWMQPIELTKLILSQRSGGSIYNPFAGVASYATQMLMPCGDDTYSFFLNCSIGNQYYAEEIDELTWAIGKLRLMALYSDSENYDLSDSADWRGGVAGNVLSTPPFSLSITNEYGKRELADHFVIRRGMDMLAKGGLLACVVPFSFLTRGDTADVRQMMVNTGWLESVVYLPSGIFSNTNINTAIIFIRKKVHDDVTFVDGTNCAIRRGKLNILEDEKLANLLHYRNYPDFFLYDSNFSMEDELTKSDFNKLKTHRSIEFIKEADYNLAPCEYFSDVIEPSKGFKLVRLGDIVSSSSLSAGISGKGFVVKPSLLSGDGFTTLNESDLKLEDYGKGFYQITSDVVFVSAGNKLRPTIFKYSGGDVVYRRDILYALVVNSDTVLPEYLVLELKKSYVLDQLRLKYSGSSMNHLSLNNLLSIYIQVPERDRQALKVENEIVEEQKLLHFARVEKELSELKDKHHDEYVKMLRQRKHRIQQVMNEFAPAFALLDKCREKNGGILRDDDIVAARTGETVRSYFHKLHTIMHKVEDLVTNFVDKENWGTPSIVNIDSYVDDIPQHHLSDKFDIQTHHDHDVYIEEEGETADLNDDRFVNINPDDLAIIFDNIIANASKWGFTETIRRDYRIRLDVSDAAIDGKSAVRVCVSNNGNPIHPSVDRKRFFDWGYGSGTGIGTWQLKNIVEHYGGSIKLNENPEETSGFVTEYEIVLPLAYED